MIQAKFSILKVMALLGIAVAGQAVSSDDPSLSGGRRLPPKAKLGQQLFFDTNLSHPAGQSCGSCHEPKVAFSDPDQQRPTSKGVLAGRFGSRNTPTAKYAAFSPAFHYDEAEGLFKGGQFLDGRAATLEEQAKAPFLNPVEMANPDKATVVDKVRQAEFVGLFKDVYGPAALDDTDQAYERIADAIAAFENTRRFNNFTSKYDAFLAGKAELTRAEKRGLKLFEDPAKGNCAACHPSQPTADGTPPLFTDFTYDNLGVPKNPKNPVYTLAPEFNLDGWDFVDEGLGAIVGKAKERGKFKVQTLRNIAVTAPYMHNGYFSDLRDVVAFYNDRDVRPRCDEEWVPDEDAVKQGCWPRPEVANNVNRDELGNLGLTDQEVDDIVTFLETLTDGYSPAP